MSLESLGSSLKVAVKLVGTDCETARFPEKAIS